MFKTFLEDRKYIENKYHIHNEPYNANMRFNYHGYPYDETTGLSDEEIQIGLQNLHEKIKALSHPIQKAKYFEYVLDNTRIDINEHDYFVGIWTWNRPLLKYTNWIWDAENSKNYEKEVSLLKTFRDAGVAFGGLDYDHTVPDWESLLSLGFKGILQRLHDSYNLLSKNGKLTQKQADFYSACVIEYEAIIRLIDRLYNYALSKSFDRKFSYSNCLLHLRDGEPTDSYEAMQLIFIYFMLSESIDNYQVRSLGYGLDASLYPFFVNDIKTGKYTKEQIGEFLAYFLMQWSAIGNYWGQPLYLGGRDIKGNSKVNELSYLILEIYDNLNIYNPKIQIKVSNNTPTNFLYKAYDMIKKGNTSIVFCNDYEIEKALLKRGANKEEAIDSVISGCYEYSTKGKSIGISGAYYNLAKMVSLVFDNGFDKVLGVQIGVKTGNIEKFQTFDDFFKAYLSQLEYVINSYFGALNKLEKGIGDINPSLMFSSTLNLCVNSMTDALDNGIENGSTALVSGLGTAVDALMAVYELVYEKKTVSLLELKTALEQDWKGYELLQRKALNCKHKYGLGDKLSDSYANKIVTFIHEVISKRKNGHQCKYALEIHSAKTYIWHGDKTMATPDGRNYGDELSKNASPHPGSDKLGVTALINSATSIDTSLADMGFCLDVMLHPTSLMGDNGLDVLHQLIKTYMYKRGHSIHFNVFNVDTLRDAQLNPTKYENLQVRVCGWNVLWNNMNKKEQDAYILRAKNIYNES